MNEKNPASIYLLLLMGVCHHMQGTSSYLRPRNGSVWSGSGSVFVSPDPIRHSSVFFVGLDRFRIDFPPIEKLRLFGFRCRCVPAASIERRSRVVNGMLGLMECWETSNATDYAHRSLWR
jgi:hypothetical protein